MKNKLLHVLMLTSALSATSLFAAEPSQDEDAVESSSSQSLSRQSDVLDAMGGDESSNSAENPGLVAAQQEISTLREALGDEQLRVQQLNANYAQLDTDYNDLEAELTTVKGALDAANSTLSAVRNELSESELQKQDLHELLARISEERNDLKAKNKKLSKAYKELEARLSTQASTVEVTPAKKPAEVIQPTSRRAKPAAASSTPADDAKDTSSTNTELASGKPAEVVQPTSRRSKPAATSAASTQQPIGDLAESNDAKETQGEVSVSASGGQKAPSEPAVVASTSKTVSREDKIEEIISLISDRRQQAAEKTRLTHDVDDKTLDKVYKKCIKTKAALAAAADSDEEATA